MCDHHAGRAYPEKSNQDIPLPCRSPEYLARADDHSHGVLRLVQGLAVGGEWGGAALMALEHASHKGRGLAGSFANMGAPAGAMLSTVVLAVVTLLPDEDFLAWGWRIVVAPAKETNWRDLTA
jgi:hypothetical protein